MINPIKAINPINNNNINNNKINENIDNNIINNIDNENKKEVIHFTKGKKQEELIITTNPIENNDKNKDNIITINTNNDKNSNNEKEKIEQAKKIMLLNELEINTLSYDLALKMDKRTYLEYYISLVKTQHDLLFPFYKDYNAPIIKYDLFFINFSIAYTINALFFNDNTIHEIYKDKGSFNLEYQIAQIIYSSLISLLLNTIVKKLALLNDDILEIKREKNIDDIKEKEKSLFRKIMIKSLLFFVIGFLLLSFFWFYLAIFGEVYKNTQYYLLKDTLISFSLNWVYPLDFFCTWHF